MRSFARTDRLRQGARTPDDDGFVLLESIIAISLITVIMSALGVFFLNTVASAHQQRNRIAAIQLANTTVENMRSRDGASLIVGRDLLSVTNQLLTAQATSLPVQPWLSAMGKAWDLDPTLPVGSGATAAIPTSPTTPPVPGNVTYTVNQYLGYCYLPSTGTGTDCTATVDLTAPRYLRAVVAVSWSGARCSSISCTYVTSTLISTAPDLTFQVNQPLPAAPLVANPGDQVNAVGDSVNLQLTVQNNTGVPNFTWTATGLPAGLTVSPTGLISNSGALTQTATPAVVTVTVTDAFLRTNTATFNWTIKPALVITPPAAQSNTLADSVNLTLVATGGEGAPYTWSSTSLPPGLSISASGTITGTPTTVGQYNNVVVTVADKSTTRTATATLTWTVTYPPLAVSNPGPRVSTVNTAIAGLQLSASGGSGGYAWSDGGTLPAGLSLSSTGLITGAATGVTGSPKSVTVTVTDATAGLTKTVTFTWAVVNPPTITSPGTYSTTETANVSVAITYGCPNTPCTISLSGSVPGLGLSATANRIGAVNTTSLSVPSAAGTVYLTGTVSASAVTSGNSAPYAPAVTITDAGAASSPTATGTWTVNVAPVVTAPADGNIARSTAISGMTASATLGTPSYTYVLSGNPAWLTINLNTGALSGTSPSARAKLGPMTVTVTDSAGVTGTDTFTWWVTDLGWGTIPTQNTTKGKNFNSGNGLNVSNYDSGGTSPYTYSASGLPTGLSMSSAGVVTGTAGTRGTFTVQATVTDAIGASAVTTFTWNVT